MAMLRSDRQRWLTVITVVLGLLLGSVAIYAVPDHSFFVRSARLADEGPTAERWACPMMDFIGTHPGACPVCGMQLKLVTAGELSREQAKRMGVQLTTVAEGPAMVTIRAYGAVRYDQRTELMVVARVKGRVVKRYDGALHPGVMVQAGDPLVDLYSAEVFVAQSELVNAIKLGNKDLVTSITERFARVNLAYVAEAIVHGGTPNDTITIRSPYAGRVLVDEGPDKEGMLKIGAEIMPDTPIVNVVDPTAYMVVIHVPEPRARLIREGQRVELASDDAGELPDIMAAISWVAPELNPEIRTREVHLHLRDPAHRLLPGSLVNARFKAVLGPNLGPADPADESTWGRFPLVPVSAVLSTGVRNVAWKLDRVETDGRQRFSIAPLALGQRLEDDHGNDFYVVRAGLSVGDQVATQGAFLIDSQAQLAGTPSLLYPLGALGAPSAPGGTAPAPAHQH